MLLHYSSITGGNQHQTERETVFEFDAEVVAGYLERFIDLLEASSSAEEAQAVWDQKYIDYLRRWQQSLQAVLAAGHVQVLDWNKVHVELRGDAERFLVNVIKNGHGTCLCPRCNTVHAVSDLEVREETGGGSGGEFVQCPCRHSTGILFSFRMSVAAESYPPSRLRVYKIGNNGNKPSLDELPYLEEPTWMYQVYD